MEEVLLYTHHKVGQPRVRFPIAFAVLQGMEVVPPHSDLCTTSPSEAHHSSRYLGLNTHALVDPSVV